MTRKKFMTVFTISTHLHTHFSLIKNGRYYANLDDIDFLQYMKIPKNKQTSKKIMRLLLVWCSGNQKKVHKIAVRSRCVFCNVPQYLCVC